MSRAGYHDAILNRNGQSIQSTIEVREENALIPIAATLYDRDGTPLTNPFPTDYKGEFEFYMDDPQRVDLYITSTGYLPTTRRVDVWIARNQVKQSLTLLVDGSNATFPTATAFVPATTQVYLNGLFQDDPEDYTESGGQSIVFGEPPSIGDKVLIVYSEEA